MKQIYGSLADFIKDFKLIKPTGEICFDATIYFSTEDSSFQLPTEVQIVRFENKELDVIYLLHPDVALLGIPDMYEERFSTFTYLPNRALVIKGYNTVNGEYVLSIHPGNNNCEKSTLAEIHSKTFN